MRPTEIKSDFNRSSGHSHLASICVSIAIKRPASSYHHHLEQNMYRIIAALFLLLVSVAASLAQGLQPSVWQGQRGSVLKVLAVDPATGNFSGVFVSNPVGPCPAVPYDVVGRIQGPRMVFQTSRNWTSDCRVTTVGSGRFVSPTTVATRWIATYVGPDGRVVRVRGTDVFQRI
jgi:hypothetical protein